MYVSKISTSPYLKCGTCRESPPPWASEASFGRLLWLVRRLLPSGLSRQIVPFPMVTTRRRAAGAVSCSCVCVLENADVVSHLIAMIYDMHGQQEVSVLRLGAVNSTWARALRDHRRRWAASAPAKGGEWAIRDFLLCDYPARAPKRGRSDLFGLNNRKYQWRGVKGPVFTDGKERRWRLKVFPKGNADHVYDLGILHGERITRSRDKKHTRDSESPPSQLGLYLEAQPQRGRAKRRTGVIEGWAHANATAFTILLHNARDPSLSIAKTSTHRFEATCADWGWANFVRLDQVDSAGFLDSEGSLRVSVRLSHNAWPEHRN